MAAKWKLPVLYVVENNLYGMGTHIARVSAEPEIHKRVGAFRMRGEAVDGMDVLKVHAAVKDLAEHVRSGKGPALLEAMTYRYRGHSMSDAATYRTKEEVDDERERDPITLLGRLMVKEKVATEAELEAIDEAQSKIILDAIQFADSSPEPPLGDVWTHHYAEVGEPDEIPRQRVRGVKVDWPKPPENFKVTWDLEPREQNAEAKRGVA